MSLCAGSVPISRLGSLCSVWEAGTALASPWILHSDQLGWPRGHWGQGWATLCAGRGQEQLHSRMDRTGKLQPQGLGQARIPPANSILLPAQGGHRGPSRARAPCLSQDTHPSLLGSGSLEPPQPRSARGFELWEQWELPHSCTSAGAAPRTGNHEYSPSISTGGI